MRRRLGRSIRWIIGSEEEVEKASGFEVIPMLQWRLDFISVLPLVYVMLAASIVHKFCMHALASCQFGDSRNVLNSLG